MARVSVETITHGQASRRNIPPAEFHAVISEEEKASVRVAYERRNPDLDPQLVWRGKDAQDAADLLVQAPPLYIQEKLHPKVLIDDLLRQSKHRRVEAGQEVPDLFADFNGLPDETAKTEFYKHDANWSNRMILGDSLKVMASLAEREGLRGKVQCIYIDPPYGIRFNSNFQWSTTSRDVKDGKTEHITREPEQVKAFRDTWRDGIHSYLTYLRDRLTVARDLLTESGSVFVQIGDENVHRVRALMDEVFGEENLVSTIAYAKTTGFSGSHLSSVYDHLLWYTKSITRLKYRPLFDNKVAASEGASKYKPVASIRALSGSTFDRTRLATSDQLTSQGASVNSDQLFRFQGVDHFPRAGLHWKTTVDGMGKLSRAGRIVREGASIRYVRFLDDFAVVARTNIWLDIGGIQSRTDPKIYVVQTAIETIKRCILMTTDPGDLVLDPTCGSGTTATVAEQWGRRWITIDTSRVALALARTRIMGARYPWYQLTDSPEGKQKEAEIARRVPTEAPTWGDIRQGFVYERVPHITLKSIANNAEIDVIYKQRQKAIDECLFALNEYLQGFSNDRTKGGREIAFLVTVGGRNGTQINFGAPDGKTVTMPSGETAPANVLLEWEVPRDRPDDWPPDTEYLLAEFWEARIARQQEIDASIAARADTEYLYDKPYEDKARIRVAGPFTVESLAPHRMLAVDEHDELFEGLADRKLGYGEAPDFAETILENLKTAGVQQTHKEDRIDFSSLTPWPGHYIAAEGHYTEGGGETGATRRAGIFIGSEFGTVARPDLVAAAREAADAGFDVLIACAFSYDAHAAEFEKLGPVPVLKARMNADLHMAGELKNTGKGNLFVIFGEPDIDILEEADDAIQVRINGVDVYHPNSGEVRSDGPKGIACWFIDTDYNEESFFVRHAYFLGANDPYKALKTTLKAEIDAEAWASLNCATSRPFPKPASGRIAVKVINHLGDEAMKVFRV